MAGVDLPEPHDLDLPRTPPLRLHGRTFDSSTPAVMAIINRTSDSFFAANRHADLESALSALESAVEAGADIVDVGGVRAARRVRTSAFSRRWTGCCPFSSTRGAVPRARAEPGHLARGGAREAGRLGLDLVNDTWAGHDPELVGVAAEIGAGVVCSHTGGLPPRTDPHGVT